MQSEIPLDGNHFGNVWKVQPLAKWINLTGWQSTKWLSSGWIKIIFHHYNPIPIFMCPRFYLQIQSIIIILPPGHVSRYAFLASWFIRLSSIPPCPHQLVSHVLWTLYRGIGRILASYSSISKGPILANRI